MRKTNKYYRTALSTLMDGIPVIAEVLKKYGYYDEAYGEYRIRGIKPEFNWNHRIDGFTLKKDGKVLVHIYWQGDSTDGTDCEYLSTIVSILRSGRDFVIPAAWDNIGGIYGMCERHSPLRIDREELLKAFKEVAKYISPEAIKEREHLRMMKKLREDVDARATKLVIEEEEKPYRGYYNKPRHYWNGFYAVHKCINENVEKLAVMDDATLKKTLKGVFDRNNKDDYYLRKTSCGPIVYDIAI